MNKHLVQSKNCETGMKQVPLKIKIYTGCSALAQISEFIWPDSIHPSQNEYL